MVSFLLANNGRRPAEKVTIELRFPQTLRISSTGPQESGYVVRDPPTPPAGLGLPPPKGRDIRSKDWYESSDLEGFTIARSLSYEGRLLERTDSYDRRKYFGCTVWRLAHGRKVRLGPLYVIFGARPIEDIPIEYKAFADNQPEVCSGRELIKVIERPSK
jgi:hypothetical protein